MGLVILLIQLHSPKLRNSNDRSQEARIVLSHVAQTYPRPLLQRNSNYFAFTQSIASLISFVYLESISDLLLAAVFLRSSIISCIAISPRTSLGSTTANFLRPALARRGVKTSCIH